MSSYIWMGESKNEDIWGYLFTVLVTKWTENMCPSKNMGTNIIVESIEVPSFFIQVIGIVEAENF